jgi:phage repressor protein C with HTH and peptisase S24 domain/lambda repressor-like predicted transcriptional regulator
MTIESFKDDPARRLVAAKIKEHGLDMARLSREIGMNQTYVQQYLTKGSPKWLPEIQRGKLARLLDIDEQMLRPPDQGEFPQGRTIQSSPLYRAMSPALSYSGPEMVPVKGTGAGGSDGENEWNGETVDNVARPQSLIGVPNAYAVYVYGDSMAPRYRHGELVFMHPGRPPSRGCYVLVQIGAASDPSSSTARALIKEYVRQTPAKLFLAQLNPPKTIEIDMKLVKGIHRIVASGEP